MTDDAWPLDATSSVPYHDDSPMPAPVVMHADPRQDRCIHCDVVLDVQVSGGTHVWSVCPQCGWTSPRRLVSEVTS